MRILVTGSRLWRSYDYILRTLARWQGRCQARSIPLTVVHGACPRGADRYANTAALRLGLPIDPYPAEWDRYGKRAGAVRNRVMLDILDRREDIVVGFLYTRDEEALRRSGTLDCLQEADSRGIPWELHTE